jgi:hypothetical protein
MPLNGAAVAPIVPDPEAAIDAPVPTTIAALVFVPPVIALNAVEPPEAQATLFMKQPAMLIVPAPFAPPVGAPITTPACPTSAISLATKGDVPAPIGNVPAVKVVRCDGPPTVIVPVPVIGEGETTMLVSPPVMLTDPPPVAAQTPATHVIVEPSPRIPPIAALVANGRIEVVRRPPVVVSTIVEFPVSPNGTLDVSVVAFPATPS